MKKVEAAFSRALGLLQGSTIARLIHQEAVARKQGLPAAEAAVEADVHGATNTVERLRALIESLEHGAEYALTRDEQIAERGAAKPEKWVLDSYIVSTWRHVKGNSAERYSEDSEFITYFRAFDWAIRAAPALDGEELAVETIRSRVAKMREWLPDDVVSTPPITGADARSLACQAEIEAANEHGRRLIERYGREQPWDK